jgi:hypothetical protein
LLHKLLLDRSGFGLGSQNLRGRVNRAKTPLLNDFNFFAWDKARVISP